MPETKIFLQLLYLPQGFMGLAADKDGILALLLPQESEHKIKEALERDFPEGKFHRFPWPKLFNELEEYYKTGRQTFSAPVNLKGVSPFTAKVLNELKKIPPGKVVSYGELGKRIGKPNAARAVGRAVGSNPIPLILPCHRVIASDGSLCGFSSPGGLPEKRALLELEGIKFTPSGKVKRI